MQPSSQNPAGKFATVAGFKAMLAVMQYSKHSQPHVLQALQYHKHRPSHKSTPVYAKFPHWVLSPVSRTTVTFVEAACREGRPFCPLHIFFRVHLLLIRDANLSQQHGTCHTFFFCMHAAVRFAQSVRGTRGPQKLNPFRPSPAPEGQSHGPRQKAVP